MSALTSYTAAVYGPMFQKAGIPKTLRRRLIPYAWAGGLIYGPSGRGKSHTAAARLVGAMLTGGARATGLYVSIPELLAAMRAAVGRDEDGGAMLDPVLGTKYVVLDDVGAEKQGEWAYEQLYLIINYRQTREFPTCVTSNLSPEELREQMGDRLASRITGFGEATGLDGKDWRARELATLPENEAWLEDRAETVRQEDSGAEQEARTVGAGHRFRYFNAAVPVGRKGEKTRENGRGVTVDDEGTCKHTNPATWHPITVESEGRAGRYMVRCPGSLTWEQREALR